MNELIKKDMQYFLDEKKDDIGLIINGLATVISGTEESLMLMEKQEWYKKMLFTIIGKNKATLEEIKRNKDKITVYLSQAIAFLYDQNGIDHKFICGLANQINELSLKQVQNKEIIGMFANKLNKKIDSVDNFHTLIETIKTNRFRDRSEIEVLCLVFSQIDNRVVKDPAKIEILKNGLSTLFDMSLSKSIKEYMLDILNMDDNDKEFILFGLRDMQTETIPRIIIDVIESYIYLSSFDKKMTSKELLVKSVLEGNNIDAMIELPIGDIFINFLDGKKNFLTVDSFSDKKGKTTYEDITENEDGISIAKSEFALFMINVIIFVINKTIHDCFEDIFNTYLTESTTKEQYIKYFKKLFEVDEYFPRYNKLIYEVLDRIKMSYKEVPNIEEMSDSQELRLKKAVKQWLSPLELNINDSYMLFDALKIESDRWLKRLKEPEGNSILTSIDELTGRTISTALGKENAKAFEDRYWDMLFKWIDSMSEIEEKMEKMWEELDELKSSVNSFVKENFNGDFIEKISVEDAVILTEYCREQNQYYSEFLDEKE